MRRLRIQRAQEYGAFWARSWGENITHVIVDKGLKYQDILCHLKLGTFPVSITLSDAVGHMLTQEGHYRSGG